MAKQLKEGTKVMIKKSSRYYNEDDSYNPRNVEGVVERHDGCAEGDNPYHVRWSNGETNVYNRADLKVVEKAQENLLSEIVYKDICGDALEVDTEMVSCVYVGKGTVDSDGDFDREGSSVELRVADVKKLRKQLKAWLTKNHPDK